jgi:hypothetical protein
MLGGEFDFISDGICTFTIDEFDELSSDNVFANQALVKNL